MELILGSQSVKRREILQFFSFPFIQIPSGFEEELVVFQGDPVAYVKELSQRKALCLQEKHPEALLLTADSVVFCEGKIYNKPSSKEEAISFLEELGGKWHSVITSLTLQKGGASFTKEATTDLRLNTLNREQIAKFHQICPFSDKCGGYSIEKGANLIVSEMRGCYYNVLGLPIQTLRELLLHFGIELWNYQKNL